MTRSSEFWAYRDEIGEVLGFLNEGEYGHLRYEDDERAELKALIDRWLKAKADWRRFLRSAIRAGVKLPCSGYCNYTIPAEAPHPLLVPGHIKDMSNKDASKAQMSFIWFILSPYRGQMGGPCRRKECGRYFSRETDRDKIYCSRYCASYGLALKSMRAKRAEIHDRLVSSAKEAIARWKRKPLGGLTWQEWVAAEVQAEILKQGIKTREVTERMIRGWTQKGELTPPV